MPSEFNEKEPAITREDNNDLDSTLVGQALELFKEKCPCLTPGEKGASPGNSGSFRDNVIACSASIPGEHVEIFACMSIIGDEKAEAKLYQNNEIVKV